MRPPPQKRRQPRTHRPTFTHPPRPDPLSTDHRPLFPRRLHAPRQRVELHGRWPVDSGQWSVDSGRSPAGHPPRLRSPGSAGVPPAWRAEGPHPFRVSRDAGAPGSMREMRPSIGGLSRISNIHHPLTAIRYPPTTTLTPPPRAAPARRNPRGISGGSPKSAARLPRPAPCGRRRGRRRRRAPGPAARSTVP